ncbi:MAG: UvrB/UvrC motif-containing protein [Phycisphaerales bacterium]|nr:UvrB/UvrC motif-containing protein [Phycisphaerales bacterium]
MENTSLSELLREWPHEPGRLNVRIVEADDGRPLVQVRVELGVLQLERHGRPDGLRPDGCESLFHRVLEQALGQGPDEVSADPGTCAALRHEAGLYSYRSAVLSILDDYAGVLEDTNRNLEVAVFIVRHAASDEDRAMAGRSIPNLLMMRARASSTLALRSGDMKSARAAIESGLHDLEEACRSRGTGASFESMPEVKVLRGMREMLVPKLPSSQRLELEARLKEALAVENFELAAILRNELRLMS